MIFIAVVINIHNCHINNLIVILLANDSRNMLLIWFGANVVIIYKE